jgi:hypothetical protein
MKRLLIGAWALLAICSQIVYADDDEDESVERCFFQNSFDKALRLPKDCVTAPVVGDGLKCKLGDKTAKLLPLSGGSQRSYDEIRPIYEALKRDHPSETIYRLSFWKSDGKGYGNLPALFYVDSPSRFRFELAENKGTINLELTDPNIKPIEYGKYPPNSVVDDSASSYVDVYIKDAVRLWENDATDQAMLCDIVVQMHI